MLFRNHTNKVKYFIRENNNRSFKTIYQYFLDNYKNAHIDRIKMDDSSPKLGSGNSNENKSITKEEL